MASTPAFGPHDAKMNMYIRNAVFGKNGSTTGARFFETVHHYEQIIINVLLPSTMTEPGSSETSMILDAIEGAILRGHFEPNFTSLAQRFTAEMRDVLVDGCLPAEILKTI